MFLTSFLLSAPATALVFHTGRNFGWIDGRLDAIDRSLGFDWFAWLAWFDAHPAVDRWAQAAYHSIFLQPFVILCALGILGRARRAHGLVTAMVFALALCAAVALFFPAAGAYAYYGVTPADHPHIDPISGARHVPMLEWLRSDGIDLSTLPAVAVGLISFPSYHAACGVIFAWAMWDTPVLRWVGVAINGAMLLATPVHGSHYLIDVLAGIAVAGIALVATERLFDAVSGTARRARPVPDAAVAGPVSVRGADLRSADLRGAD